MHGHVVPGEMEEVIVSGEGLAYDVQPREQKVPSLSICTGETYPLQSNGSTSQGSDSQREAVDRGLGPLACLTLMSGH